MMKESIDELLKQLRSKTSDQILVDRIVRAVRQEKASSHIEALMEEASPTVEKLAEHLEYEMASLLQNALDDGTLNPSGFVKDNRHTLKLISKGAAISFQKIA